jgi:hypothetical protein
VAGAAAGDRGPAVGPVECDDTALEREARRANRGRAAIEDATALAIAAIAAVARTADSPIQGD